MNWLLGEELSAMMSDRVCAALSLANCVAIFNLIGKSVRRHGSVSISVSR